MCNQYPGLALQSCVQPLLLKALHLGFGISLRKATSHMHLSSHTTKNKAQARRFPKSDDMKHQNYTPFVVFSSLKTTPSSTRLILGTQEPTRLHFREL